MPRSVIRQPRPVEQAEENRAIGVVGLARAKRRARLAQLVAGREQRDLERPEHLEPVAAEGRGDADVLRPEPDAGLERHLARAHVLAGLAPVRAALHARRDHHGIAVELDVLLHQGGVGAVWHRRAGQDPQRGARAAGAR